MLSKDPIRIAGPLGRIYSFTRHYQGDNFYEGPRLAFYHDRAYARDHLLRLTRSVASITVCSTSGNWSSRSPGPGREVYGNWLPT